MKTTDSIKKEKYEAIKEDIIKHVKHDDETEKKDQAFVNRQSRVTNAVIKSILKLNNPQEELNANSKYPKVEKQIKKKEKKNLKKEIWNKSIYKSWKLIIDQNR